MTSDDKYVSLQRNRWNKRMKRDDGASSSNIQVITGQSNICTRKCTCILPDSSKFNEAIYSYVPKKSHDHSKFSVSINYQFSRMCSIFRLLHENTNSSSAKSFIK
uniref:Uncharacterized protein n=1 Tax=Arundo donax TaxID=35708 RepID=A0A0A9CXV6_ARUDO